MIDNHAIEFRGDHIHVTLAPDIQIAPGDQDEFWNRLDRTSREFPV